MYPMKSRGFIFAFLCLELVVAAFCVNQSALASDLPRLVLESPSVPRDISYYDLKLSVDSPREITGPFVIGVRWDPDVVRFIDVNGQGGFGDSFQVDIRPGGAPVAVISEAADCDPCVTIPAGTDVLLFRLTISRWALPSGPVTTPIEFITPDDVYGEYTPRFLIDGRWEEVPVTNGLVTFLETYTFLRGDVNLDGKVDLSDPIRMILVLFAGHRIRCLNPADSNDDGRVDLSDVIHLLDYLYLEGPLPPPPSPNRWCWVDPTENVEDLDCLDYSCGQDRGP